MFRVAANVFAIATYPSTRYARTAAGYTAFRARSSLKLLSRDKVFFVNFVCGKTNVTNQIENYFNLLLSGICGIKIIDFSSLYS